MDSILSSFDSKIKASIKVTLTKYAFLDTRGQDETYSVPRHPPA
jgi:hypothetical protein